MYKILTLNIGSTSSKLAIYEDDNEVFVKTIRHTQEDLQRFDNPSEQFEWRRDVVFAEIEAAGWKMTDFDCVCTRSGPLTPVESGTYTVNEAVVDQASDPLKCGSAPHVLGIRIADAITKQYGVPSYFCDPVTTDELDDVARISGMNGVPKTSGFHALNHKAVARKAAAKLGKKYEEVNLVGIHLGGGCSQVAHRKGRCIETLSGMSMDRAGSLVPYSHVIDWAFDNFDNKRAATRAIGRRGGVFSYLGTTDFKDICERARSGKEPEVKRIYDAFIYQHSVVAGALAAALKFDVDAIYITGGIAFDEQVVEEIKGYIGKIAPVLVFPGEEEMKSLAENALRVLTGETQPKEYIV